MQNDLHIRIKNGDKEAFSWIYTTYYKALCRYAFSIVKDPDSAEELVQDVLFKLWERRTDLNLTIYIKEYLYKAVFNNCLNYLRKKKTEKMYQRQFIDRHQEIFEHTDKVVIQELETNINNAIEALPERCREIFQMNRFEGLTYNQIAEKMNLTTKGVEYHMNRAIKQLMVDLNEYL